MAVVDGQFIALVAVHGGAAGVTGFDGVEILAAHIRLVETGVSFAFQQ